MVQRILLIAVFVVLLVLSTALLIAEAGREDLPAASETDYVSLDETASQTELLAAPQSNTSTDDIRILSLIAVDQMEDIETQGIPPEDLELDYGDAAFNSPK
jgi:hypothetical protein